MIAVIFEAQPHPERGEAYLDAAQQLRPLLADIDGFISIERFGSLAAPGKMLSLSFWRDEPAVRSEAHTSELQSLMRISYAVFCLNKDKHDRSDAHAAVL